MNQKMYEKFLVGSFCCFITGLLLVNVATADEEFSPTENRKLAQQPEMTVETVMEGDYMTDFETYLNDQFFMRDHWVALKSVMERLVMKQENNDVFFGKQDTLINKVKEPNQEQMDKSAGYINTMVENLDVPVYVGLIPSAACIWSDRLPSNAPTANEVEVIGGFYDSLDQQIVTLPMIEGLMPHKNEDLYYRTDHHWTTLGAYYGYETVATTLGHTPTPLSNYTETVVSDSFFGTIYSSSGVRWVKPDTISTYVPADKAKVTSNFTGTAEEGAMYVDKYLDEKDKYSYFFGGVQPLCILETDNTDGEKILILRDSYADSMVPFLTEHYAEIHMIDLRFYHAGVSSYVNANEIDQVMVFYSVSNFSTDTNLFKLAM